MKPARRVKSPFDRIAQQNRLLWAFLQHDTAERNKRRIMRVLFEGKDPILEPTSRAESKRLARCAVAAHRTGRSEEFDA